jgi:hypothetical protein
VSQAPIVVLGNSQKSLRVILPRLRPSAPANTSSTLLGAEQAHRCSVTPSEVSDLVREHINPRRP